VSELPVPSSRVRDSTQSRGRDARVSELFLRVVDSEGNRVSRAAAVAGTCHARSCRTAHFSEAGAGL